MSREEAFSQMMDQIYNMAQVLQKTNLSKQYGSEDLLFMNEVHTLKTIYDRPGLSLGELAEQTFRTNGSTSLMVDKLVSKGLVEKRRSGEDSRRYELVPTEKGTRVAQFHRKYDQEKYKDILSQLMSDVSEEEILSCGNILDRLIQYRLSAVAVGMDKNEREI